MIKLKRKQLFKKKKKLTQVYASQHVESVTYLWNQDNLMESKLNKIMKINSQTNLILKGKLKKNEWKKNPSQPLWARRIHDPRHEIDMTQKKRKLKNKECQSPTNLILRGEIKK
jgi:hypothetical protein